MTVDNSALLAELLGKLEDKEAASVWGPIAERAAKEDGGRTKFWKRADGNLEGTVTRVYLKDNYEKTGQNPAFDLDVNGQKVTFELTTTVLQKAAARQLVQTGERIRIELAQTRTNGKYYNDKLTVLSREESSEVPF